MAAAIENLMVTQGDAELAEVFRAHQAAVLRAAYRLTGNMADAEDVAQSIFLRLARGGLDRSRISHLQSYLHRSAVNGALDLIRARSHRQEVEFETARAQPSDIRLSPERSVSALEIRNWLRRELATLSPRAAEMFVLRYFEGLDNPEIARMMKTSQAVVAVTLYRVRARLKNRLRGFVKGAS